MTIIPFCILKPIWKPIEISVGNETYIPVTYKPKIDDQTFSLIFLALNIRVNERETVTSKHVTYKPKGVFISFKSKSYIWIRNILCKVI